MQVRTFTGTDTAALDKQVNDWLAKSKVQVRRTSTAFKGLKEQGKDAVTGKTFSRRAVAIAISVWYDEPASKTARSKPATAKIKSGQQTNPTG
jgi:hypothetical protein